MGIVQADEERLVRDNRASGDLAAEGAAIDALLSANPTNLAALLMRGDCHRRAGDPRAAASFFQAALDQARALPSPVPPALAAPLQAAQAFVAARANDFRMTLETAVGKTSGARLRHALDMLIGKREIFQQQPSALYFPYLPQRQFYEREEFPWAAGIEAATPAIHAELVALIDGGADFRPYIELEQNRPHRDFHRLAGDPSWSAFYLWKDGDVVPDNAARCPATMAALERVPLSRIGRRTPAVLFSLLRPGAHIPPHYGMLNSRLICHLPLTVPPDCWLRVGNETRQWEEGKLLIFDDSIEHEAKNSSNRLRVILLFDIWKPELDQAERAGVSAIFDAIDDYRGIAEDH